MLRGWACVFPHLCPAGIAIAAPGKSALQKAGQEELSGLLNHTTAQVTQQLTLATRPRLGTPDQASADGPTGKHPLLRIWPHLLPGWEFLARNSLPGTLSNGADTAGTPVSQKVCVEQRGKASGEAAFPAKVLWGPHPRPRKCPLVPVLELLLRAQHLESDALRVLIPSLPLSICLTLATFLNFRSF